MNFRAATADKAGKVWSLPRFWVSIRTYKKQPVKKCWGRILDLAWLRFAVAALQSLFTLDSKLAISVHKCLFGITE